jgi:L-alanine-DL-glutamate epimerase-like enolase superfamily enzyme
MKVTGIRSGIVNLPADEPLAGAADNPNGKRPIVWVRVASSVGEGIGVAYFGGALTGTLRHAIEELGALAVGEDAHRVEGIHAKWKNAAGGSAGPGGVYNLAISALDMALWDIRGKDLNQPLWRLLGGGRDKVPTYASGALMRELSLDRVVKAAATLKDKGWKEMKTQMALPGEKTPAIEV